MGLMRKLGAFVGLLPPGQQMSVVLAHKMVRMHYYSLGQCTETGHEQLIIINKDTDR